MTTLRKEVPMSNRIFRNVQDIEMRKTELRYQIYAQEERLSKDFDAYKDDWDSLCNTWNFLFGRHNSKKSGLTGSTSGLITYFTIGYKVLSWIIGKFKNRKK